MQEIPTGSVVTVPYPYSDLSGVKRRPAVVCVSWGNEEYLLCSVTSQQIQHDHGIALHSSDFESGGLRMESQVRMDKLFTTHSDIIGTVVGQLRPEYLQKLRR